MTQPTLKELAEQEATEAEAEATELGIQDEPEAEAAWERDNDTQTKKVARAALKALKAGAVGGEATVDLLMQCTDVVDPLTMPKKLAGGMGPEDERIHPAPYLEAIGRYLLRGCGDLQLKPNQVQYGWKNVKTWTEAQAQVRVKGYRLDEAARWLAGDARIRVLLLGNFQHLRLLNTRQRIASVYNALRERDENGRRLRAPVRVFTDELVLFGAGTFQADVELRRALDLASQRELPFHFEHTNEE